MTPNTIVISITILIATYFLFRSVLARRQSVITGKAGTYENYLFASRELSTGEMRESMAATYSAFATVFFWFVALGGIYSWLLFLIPIFLFVGNYLFTKIIERYNIQLGNFSTIGAYIQSQSTFKPLHYISSLIVVVFLFSALLVEIVIGSGILAGLIPGIFGGQLFFVILLSLLVISYVIIAGFRMVIHSDRTQLYLTFIGAILLLLFSIAFLKTSPGTSGLLYAPRVTFSSLLAFLVSVVAIQLFGPLCQLQNWQRISGSKDQTKALRAHRQGALISAVLWAIMIISALVLFVKLKGDVNFGAIFEMMKAGGILTAYIFYPIVFIGFIAAMISTADSALSALYLYFFSRVKSVREKRGRVFNPTDFSKMVVGIGIFVLILLIYIINQSNIQNLAISFIYFLFNQLIVIFPSLLFLIVKDKILRRREITIDTQKIERNLALATGLGWLTVFVMSGIGYFSASLNWIMFASGSGVVVATIISLPSWLKLRAALKI